jgi:hypothetical protein
VVDSDTIVAAGVCAGANTCPYGEAKIGVSLGGRGGVGAMISGVRRTEHSSGLGCSLFVFLRGSSGFVASGDAGDVAALLVGLSAGAPLGLKARDGPILGVTGSGAKERLGSGAAIRFVSDSTSASSSGSSGVSGADAQGFVGRAVKRDQGC